MKFEFIRMEKGLFPVALMCEVLAVSRSGFYAWARRPKAKRDIDDERLSVHVVAAHASVDAVILAKRAT